MNNRRVACPRCGQDWLVHVRLVHLSRNAVLCPECDALWQQPGDIGPTGFEDYGTFMTRHGRKNPEQKGEIEIEGELMREGPA
jgi:hypothetical protein